MQDNTLPYGIVEIFIVTFAIKMKESTVFHKALRLGIEAAITAGVAVLLTSNGYAKEFSASTVPISALPSEAREVLASIQHGGPFSSARDGTVFGNYEHRLPPARRGYYHEYTVPTPGAHNRGARRIIVGGKPPSHGDYFYTSDHYNSFQRIQGE